jgi:AcrR family transcriptional regulator
VIRAIVRQNVKRGQFVGIPAEALDDRLPGCALQRSELEDRTVIVLENEPEQMAAESTHPVVEHEMGAFAPGRHLHLYASHVLILMNMFTQNVKARKRGRPPGQTPQGAAARERLYATAMQLIARHGYAATTLRDIAQEAGVSVGLLYRYFPSKQAVVIALYDELSSEYARQAADLPPGRWRDRFIFALRTSLDVLEPHQVALRALTPVLVGDPDEGIFSASTAFSRLRVQQVFEQAVVASSDAPKQPLAAALGRLLYLVHLTVLLWWLLDKSSNQRATAALVSLIQQLLPSAALTLRIPPVRRFVISVDELVRDALFGNPVSA